MRILFILEYFHPHIGGVETLFSSLTKSLAIQGHEVTVLTNRFDKNLPKREVLDGVTIKRLSFYNRYLFTFLAGFASIREARRNDIIHTTSYNAAIPAYIASRWTNTKVIITFHEVWGDLWFKLPWISWLSRRLFYLFEKVIIQMNFDHFIAVSNATADMLVSNGVSADKITTIHNGIDYEEFEARREELRNAKYQFLYFGRLGISKGVDILLEAVQSLLKVREDFEMTLVFPHKQDGLSKKVFDLIKQYNISSCLTVLDSLPYEELKSKIKKSNAVVIPSYSEGFCFAAVETMALGTPIVSSGQGALNEVVGGHYLEFDNMSAEDLKEKLISAMEERWNERPINKFHLKDSVDKYQELLSNIANVNEL